MKNTLPFTIHIYITFFNSHSLSLSATFHPLSHFEWNWNSGVRNRGKLSGLTWPHYSASCNCVCASSHPSLCALLCEQTTPCQFLKPTVHRHMVVTSHTKPIITWSVTPLPTADRTRLSDSAPMSVKPTYIWPLTQRDPQFTERKCVPTNSLGSNTLHFDPRQTFWHRRFIKLNPDYFFYAYYTHSCFFFLRL